MASSAAPSSVTLPPSQAQRSLMIDIVKGLAILLVAMGHTNQGLQHDGVVSWCGPLNNFIYAFHMPAFFFVSGVFLRPSLHKRGLLAFVKSKMKTLLWPHVMLSLVLTPLTVLLLGRWMHSGHMLPLKMQLSNLVTGNEEWFLPTLFLCTVLAGALEFVPPLLLFAAFTVGMHFYPERHIAVLDRPVTLLPFLLLGMWVGRRYELLERVPRALAAVLAVPLGLLIFWKVPVYGLFMWDWWFVPLGVAGTLMLLLLARALGTGRPGRVAARLGVASLGIYIFAAYGQGLGRLLLSAAHVHSPLLHLVLDTALAVTLATWVYQNRVRLRLAWLLEWPFGRV